MYFGSRKKILYSYDGKNVEQVCNVGFPVWCLHGIENKKGGLIYGGGGDSGECIFVVSPTDSDIRIILKDETKQVLSIVSAPLDYIERLRDGK